MRRRLRWLSIAFTTAAVAVCGFEILLQIRAAVLEANFRDTSALGQRRLAYRPFRQQHAHPYYGFFFPLDARGRQAIGNAVCSLDAHGFREPGPGHAGGRKLAFLLGGSAAFGDYASSNDQTITSHLNRLQDEWYFVNAGVPSWNSTQELVRLALDIVERRPGLIVAYDGANDAVLAGQRSDLDGNVYPPGTPEFFSDVELVIAEARLPLSKRLHPARLFPELALRFDRIFRPDDDGDEDRVSQADVVAAARRYRSNHARMAELTAAAGARFVSVFQPVANLHQGQDQATIGRRPLMEDFHREATMVVPLPYAFHDLSRLFDDIVNRITLASPTLAGDALFVDEVHLTDRGNAMVAEKLWSLIVSSPGR
jgi:hypothetical protein